MGGDSGRPRVTVVLPTYNERENVSILIPRLARVLEEAGLDYEILVVDDNSPDGTCEEVERIASNMGDGRIRCIRRVGERGLSSAVVRGFREARGDIAVVLDADNQHPPEVVPLLVEKVMDGADIAVASRYTRGGGVEEWSRVRLVLSKIANRIAHLLVPETRKTSDPMAGFFAVRLDRIDLDRLQPRGFKILVEILGRHPCLRVVDVPYTFRKRHAGRSKIGVRVATDFLRQAWSLSPMPRFMLVGASGTIVNLAVMAMVLSATGHVDIASLAGIEASIISNYLLHEVYTFKTKFARTCGTSAAGRLIRYHYASAAGIVTTYATMKLLTLLGILTPIPAQAVGILLGFIANYIISTGGVWNCGRGCE